MTLFCFLWTPLFYFFWRSLNEDSELPGGAWALVLGSAAAFSQFFLGALISPGGFGFSRWLAACIDIVALPAVMPFIICLVFVFFRILPKETNFTNMAFLWLIPVAALKALNWSVQNNPILLLAVPLLWTALAMGIGYFLQMMQNGWGKVFIPAIFGALVLPFLAATAYWAFFSQYTLAGFILLGISLIPMGISLLTTLLVKMTPRKG